MNDVRDGTPGAHALDRHALKRAAGGALRRGGAVILTLCGMATLPMLAGGGEAKALAALQPHRAVYDVTLAESSSAAGVSGVRGRMVYELTGSACDGYSVSFRFVTQVADDNGQVRITDLQTSSFEEPAGKAYQFLSKTFINQKLSEETRGRARHEKAATEIELQKPAERKVNLPASVLFPTQHMNLLLESAAKGEVIFTADVFDGSESGDKLYGTSSVIGARREGAGAPENDNAEAVAKIGNVAHWPITIAYFDDQADQAGERTPVYQLGFLLYENGISRRLLLDYGDLELRGNLVELTPFDPSACDR